MTCPRRFLPLLTTPAVLVTSAMLAGCSDPSEGEDAAAPAAGNAPEAISAADPAAPRETGAAPSRADRGAGAGGGGGDGEAPHPLGEPRDDLGRFYGVYGSSDSPGRDFFVAPAKRPEGAREQIPPGYLMVGAMWGDVAPFYMKSLGELEFGQRWVNPHAEAVELVFEPGDGGEDSPAGALRFRTVFDGRGRLERLGDLPDDWE